MMIVTFFWYGPYLPKRDLLCRLASKANFSAPGRHLQFLYDGVKVYLLWIEPRRVLTERSQFEFDLLCFFDSRPYYFASYFMNV